MNHIRPTEVPGNGNNSLKSEGGDSRDSRGSVPRFQVIIPFRARPSYCVEIKGGDPRTAGKGLKELSIASET